MKKKSTSQSAPARVPARENFRRSLSTRRSLARRLVGEGGFFNLRVLNSLFALLVGVFLALVGSGALSNASSPIKGLSTQARRTVNPMPPSGSVQEAWVARYNGPGNRDDYGRAIAVDGSGNVYVTGQSIGPDGVTFDYATIKYNASGAEDWVARYDGPANSYDYAQAIAIDGAGNVYVTGGSIGSGTDFDFATIKYNSAGQEQWVARYNGPGNARDWAQAIAVDGSGNVYVTGNSAGSGIFDDYATIKYDSAGQEQWVSRYNGPGSDYDDPHGIAVDDSGNVYVTGQSGSGPSAAYATVKYDSAGQEQWVSRYNGPGNDSSIGTAIAVDGSGNVYVTGQSVGSGY